MPGGTGATTQGVSGGDGGDIVYFLPLPLMAVVGEVTYASGVGRDGGSWWWRSGGSGTVSEGGVGGSATTGQGYDGGVANYRSGGGGGGAGRSWCRR